LLEANLRGVIRFIAPVSAAHDSVSNAEELSAILSQYEFRPATSFRRLVAVFLAWFAAQTLLFEEQKIIDLAGQLDQLLRILLFRGQLTELLPSFFVFAHDRFLILPPITSSVQF
jgi:hypothetical protein